MIYEGIDEQYCAEIKALLTEPCIDHGQKGNSFGYRQVYNPIKNGSPRMVYLHRKVYCEHHGISLNEISGKIVMHLCDNPRCIEPSHLKLGTHKENMMDCMKKGRRRNYRVKQNPSKYLYKEFESFDDNDYVS